MTCAPGLSKLKTAKSGSGITTREREQILTQVNICFALSSHHHLWPVDAGQYLDHNISRFDGVPPFAENYDIVQTVAHASDFEKSGGKKRGGAGPIVQTTVVQSVKGTNPVTIDRFDHRRWLRL